LRVVIDECLNMSLQEIGGNRHLKSSNATASFENTVKIDHISMSSCSHHP
jgi:hypothetical protein